MAGIFNKKNGGGAQPAYATKADVILQREAEIVARLDQLLAAVHSSGQADSVAQKTEALAQKTDLLADKMSRETSYISKQSSAIYEKLHAENVGLKQEMGYLAAQCENVFSKLSGMIAALEQRLGEKIDANAIDYEKLAPAAEPVADEVATFDDEVAPAAVEESESGEQLSISEGYIDYDVLADNICGKLEEKGLVSTAIDYDELAKKVADSLPPQEIISPDYVASKVAEQIVLPEGEASQQASVVYADAKLDYDLSLIHI